MAPARKTSPHGDHDSFEARQKLLSGHWMVRIREDERPPLTDAELRELWAEVGPELLPAFVADHPGERPHAWWAFGALPQSPRRRLEPTDEAPTTTEPPQGLLRLHPDAHESSYRYLKTRGLLLAGEVDRTVAKYSGEVERTIESYRLNLQRIALPYRRNAMLYPHQLATLADIFGDELLTGDELAAAAPFRFTNGKAH